MKTYVQAGETVPMTAPYAVVAGGGLLVGSNFGIAIAAAASGATVQARRVGVVDCPKATGQAWTEGVLVYWDNTAKVVTNVSTSNKLIGIAFQAQASGDAVGRVNLTGQVS